MSIILVPVSFLFELVLIGFELLLLVMVGLVLLVGLEFGLILVLGLGLALQLVVQVVLTPVSVRFSGLLTSLSSLLEISVMNWYSVLFLQV